MLSLLLSIYSYKGEPKYISNIEIVKYIERSRASIAGDDFRVIRDYFLKQIGVPRRAR